MNSHAVIFDCDGVLVDSEYLCARVVRIMATELGLALSERAAFRLVHGRKVATWIAEIEELIGHPVAETFVPEFRRRSAAVFEGELRAVPQVEDVIRSLKVPYCLASSAPYEKIIHELRITGLLGYFTNRIYSAYEVGFWKPHPGLFLHAARELGTVPEHCAVIEDSVVGVRAGVAAGMTVFGYATADTADLLAAAGALTFRSMTELPVLLDQWVATTPRTQALGCRSAG